MNKGRRHFVWFDMPQRLDYILKDDDLSLYIFYFSCTFVSECYSLEMRGMPLFVLHVTLLLNEHVMHWFVCCIGLFLLFFFSGSSSFI